MSFIVEDRIKQQSTTIGTGPFVLSFNSTYSKKFSDVCSVSDTFVYSIQHKTADEWETGYGTYLGSDIISRDVILSSSNSNNLVDFSDGKKDVFITLSSENFVYKDSNGYIDISNSEISLKNIKFSDNTQQNTAVVLSEFGKQITTKSNSIGVLESLGYKIYSSDADAIDSLGKNLLIPSNYTAKIRVPEDSPNVFTAYAQTESWITQSNASILIDVDGKFDEKTIINLSRDNTLIQGRTVISANLINIVSVTGNTGNWAITATLDDASGVSVGDGIGIKNVRAGVHVAPGSYVGAINKGEIRLAFFQLGYMTSNGSNCVTYTSTPNDKNVSTYISPGFLIHTCGLTRAVTNVGANGVGSFTISSPLGTDLTDVEDPVEIDETSINRQQYWYYMPPFSGNISNTQTVSSNTFVNGNGTSFLTETNVGDIIFIDGSGPREIIEVVSNTQIKVKFEYSLGEVPNITTDTRYSIVTNGEFHEGQSVVTAVNGNQVSFINYGRNEKPPINNIVGGSVSIQKTVLTYTDSAFQIKGGCLQADKLCLVGPTTTSSIAFDLLKATPRTAGGKGIMGSGLGIVKFGQSARVIGGTHIDAIGSLSSGQTSNAFAFDIGGTGDLTDAVINGGNAIGVLLAGGSNCRLSNTRIVNTKGIGLRLEVGSSSWSDFTIIGGTGSYGCLLVGSVNAHLVGLRSFLTKAGAIYGQNGGVGRASGALILCCRSNGIGLYNSWMETNQASVAGCYAAGVLVGRSRLSFTTAGSCFNRVYGIRGLELSHISGDNSYFSGNRSYNTMMQRGSKINIRSGYIGPAGTPYRVYAATGGVIWLDNTKYSNTFPILVNDVGKDGSTIYDSAANSGAKIVPITGSVVWNPGTVAAGGTANTEFVFPGATTTNCGIVYQVNGLIDDGIDVRPTIRNSNNLIVHIQNTTANSILVGNRTWSFIVLKVV